MVNKKTKHKKGQKRLKRLNGVFENTKYGGVDPELKPPVSGAATGEMVIPHAVPRMPVEYVVQQSRLSQSKLSEPARKLQVAQQPTSREEQKLREHGIWPAAAPDSVIPKPEGRQGQEARSPEPAPPTEPESAATPVESDDKLNQCLEDLNRCELDKEEAFKRILAKIHQILIRP